MRPPAPTSKSIFGRALEIESPAERCRLPGRGLRGGPGAPRGGRGPARCAWRAPAASMKPAGAAGSVTIAHAPIARRARHEDRPVQAAPADRRGRHGRRLHGRAGAARPPQGRAQDHQAGDGQHAGRRPVRSRAPGPGHDGPHQHRPGLRRRHDRDRPALLRHGAGPRRADHRVLRRQPAHAPRAPRAVRPGLPGDPARRTRRGSSTATSSRRTSW